MIRDLTLEQKIEVAAEQIENSLDICFVDEKKQIRLILTRFAQELVSGDYTGEKQCNEPAVSNPRELLLAFNKEMAELHHWFLPAEESMIADFLSQK